MRKLLFLTSALVVAPTLALAHEVYVLPKEVVAHALTMPSLQMFDIIHANAGSFFFWMFISVWAIFTILSISLTKPVERYLLPLLTRLKPHAALVARITLGSAITASGFFAAMFGPELAFGDFLSPSMASLVADVLIVSGTLITAGLFTRIVALVLAVLYFIMWAHYGVYMLTYANYLGEILLTLIIGNSSYALDRYFHHLYPHTIHRLVEWLEHHAFFILRVCFGVSLIFASMYAKFIYAQLALETVIRYNLTDYFPFEPSFIVLGAFCIELLLGLFFILGFEVRFASLFLLFWLTLSLLYFGEAVWPHIILAGCAIAIFMHGYDDYTVEFGLMRRRYKWLKEPVF